MSDDLYNSSTMTCDECEAVASRACDGECSPEELASLKAHVAECPSCRETLRMFRDLSAAVAMRSALDACPPPPSVRDIAQTKVRPISSFMLKLGGIAASIAIAFAAGHFAGQRAAVSDLFAYLSPMVVSTPSMWSASKAQGHAAVALDSEQPFTDSIKRYRSSVADELRKDRVDWARVRSLIEAIGELRTDLELLTIHLAFLEIDTGTAAMDVADRWEHLGGAIGDQDGGSL